VAGPQRVTPNLIATIFSRGYPRSTFCFLREDKLPSFFLITLSSSRSQHSLHTIYRMLYSLTLHHTCFFWHITVAKENYFACTSTLLAHFSPILVPLCLPPLCSRPYCSSTYKLTYCTSTNSKLAGTFGFAFHSICPILPPNHTPKIIRPKTIRPNITGPKLYARTNLAE